VGTEQWQALARWFMLQIIDKHWKDHLLSMDYLKEGIGLRGYGQKNPLNEYKREGFDMFVDMTERIKADVIEYLFKIQIAEVESTPAVRPAPSAPISMPARYVLQGAAGATTVTEPKTVRRQGAKVGRNAQCPCGSGKKYKRCCGALS
jgi:preprotein translocase subunit SecA